MFFLGDYVLVHGAGGGVGLAAVTIAKALGMYVIASADTEKKRQVAKTFGAHHVVDARGDWAEQAKSCTPGKRGVDVVLDPLGVIGQSLKCIRWDGRLVVIGFAAGEIEKIPTNRLLLKNVSLSGLFWGMYSTMDAASVVEVWDTLLKIIDKGGIRPLHYTEQEFRGLEDVPAALKLLSTGTAWGKIVIDISDSGKSKL
jgi:NADPH2:quinone reductase